MWLILVSRIYVNTGLHGVKPLSLQHACNTTNKLPKTNELVGQRPRIGNPGHQKDAQVLNFKWLFEIRFN
jgi:hypothetical protein